MAVLILTRFKVDPADTEEMLARRRALLGAVRDASSELTEARLAKLNDETWIDQWRWDSFASHQAAANAAPSMPEVSAAFSIVKDVRSESADIVDERLQQ